MPDLRFIALSICMALLGFSCSKGIEPEYFCEILGVAQSYEDEITIEVVKREMQVYDVALDALCSTASERALEIGYNRRLTGEDTSSEGSEVMRRYLEYKNSVLDAIIRASN